MKTKLRWQAHLVIGFLIMAASISFSNRLPGQEPGADQDTGKIVQLKPEPAVNPSSGAIRLHPSTQGHPVLSSYWIGTKCYGPLPGALAAQLNLPLNQGILVVDVVPESPAAKAGLKINDILLTVDTKPIEEVAQLVEAVENTEGKKSISVEILRGGKKQTIEIFPAARPEEMAQGRPFGRGEQDLDPLQQWFEQMHPGLGGSPPMRLRFFHPGTILPPGASIAPPLPEELSISITRQGKTPAKIIVQRNDDRWELTENDLSELPDDVRGHVQRMLDGVVVESMPQFDFLPGAGQPMPKTSGKMVLPKRVPGASVDYLKKQMQHMDQQMQKMRGWIEEMENQPPAEEK